MCVLEAVSKPEARFALRHITAHPETQTLKSDLASVHLFYLEIAPPLNVLDAHTIIFDRSPLGRPLSTADYQMELLRVRSSVQVVLRTQSANQSGPSVRPSQFLTDLSGLQRLLIPLRVPISQESHTSREAHLPQLSRNHVARSKSMAALQASIDMRVVCMHDHYVHRIK